MPAPLAALADALAMAFAMFWEIFWALALGFMLSAAIQALVPKGALGRLLPDARPGTLGKAALLGAASSSCSYAAVAIARSMVRKGADFTAAMAFEFASTNLVIELGAILWLLMGWQFALAEYLGGFLMILLLALLFRIFLRKPWVNEAVRQAGKGIAGKMEGHAGHDMSVEGDGPLLRKLASKRGLTAVSHFFAMDLSMLWKEILAGLLVAGALSAWVPDGFWQGLFLQGQSGSLSTVWSAAIGPAVAVLSSVCSVGNVPLAAVLWRGGIGFGGVVSFLFADLLILPILAIYRKYYGLRMAAFIAGTSYLAMVAAGLLVEAAFSPLGLIPSDRRSLSPEPHISLNYTGVLNAILFVAAALLLWRFFRTGGPDMLRMMDGHDSRHGSPGREGADRCPIC